MYTNVKASNEKECEITKRKVWHTARASKQVRERPRTEIFRKKSKLKPKRRKNVLRFYNEYLLRIYPHRYLVK